MSRAWHGTRSRIQVVVIAVSTGGPSALELMLPMLPEDFPVPILISQHMPRQYTLALAERLSRICTLPVFEARAGQVVPGAGILVAPGDEHMELAGGHGGSEKIIRLHRQRAANGCMPSADFLFASAARVCGAGTLALVMTGMGSDGLQGAHTVRAAGGLVMAQDEASSAVWGMPGRVVEAGLTEAAVPLSGMAAALVQVVRGTAAEDPALPANALRSSPATPAEADLVAGRHRTEAANVML